MSKKSTFEALHQELKLSHHPFRRSLLYLDWAFKEINFEGKKVLDIGGGNGIYSYYAKYRGASYCINLEPFADGSDNINIVGGSSYSELEIDLIRKTVQEYETNIQFDVIIIHDSINHFDEANFSKLHQNESSYQTYSSLIGKIRSLLVIDGKLVVADCSRVNFFNSLNVKNPLAPSIEWHIHQHPPILIKLFEENSFKLEKLRWSPFKRFYRFGHFLSTLGFTISYFMQSHYNMVFRATTRNNVK